VKNYILDTNVLLHDPNSLLSFDENCVLIPIEVIEEIDRFKREATERGQNARTFSRTLDALRSKGRLSDGVPLSTGGKLKVVFQKPGENGQVVVGSKTVDSRIVALALHIQKAEPKTRTILVTKDINLRIKADALGLQAEDYESDRVMIKDLYTGMIELTVSAEKMAFFRANGELELNGGKQYLPNEYCTLLDETNPKRAALSKVDSTGTKLLPIIDADGSDSASFDECLELLLAIALPACLGFAITAPHIANVILGEGFRSMAIVVMPIVSIAVIFQILSYQYLHISFLLSGRNSFYLLNTGSVLAFNATLSYFLILRFGAAGAAWGRLAAELFGFATALILTRWAFPIPLSLRRIARVLTAAMVMAITVRGADLAFAIPDKYAVAVVIPAGVASYLVMCLALNVAGARTHASQAVLAVRRIFAPKGKQETS